MNFFLPLLASLPTTTRRDNLASALPQPINRTMQSVSLLAAALLLGVALLAFSPYAETSIGDRITLLFLALCAAIAGWTPLRKYFDDHDGGEEGTSNDGRNAASFALCVAMFLVYSLARRVTPAADHGPTFSFALLPDDKFPISYAAMLVVPSALICGIAARLARARQARTQSAAMASAWPRALATAIVIIGLLTAGSFRFLSGFYKVGATETLDPTPLAQVLMQAVEYLALALLCHVATASVAVRHWMLRVLPLLLFALWARHQFSAPLPETEDEG